VLLPLPVALVAGRHLDALVRKMLVQSDRAVLPGKRGFRFQHALIHDTAYARLPKALRAELHERVADWLEERAGARLVEFEELVGYHLECACRYKLELGANDDAVRQLADRAAERLAAVGRRAFQRIHYGAAVGLLERALNLMAEDDPRSVELLNSVGTALGPLGERERRASVLDLTTARARRLGDRRGEWLARLECSNLNVIRQPGTAMREERRGLAKRALRVFEDLRDPLGVARAAHCLAVDVLIDSSDASAAEVLCEKSLAHARASGVAREEVRCQWVLADVLRVGPTPVPTAIVRCEEVLEAAPDPFLGTVGVSGNMGVLLAMNGQFDEARRLVEHARSILSAIAHPRPFTFTASWVSRIAVLAGDFHGAEAACREGLQIARDIGERMHGDLLAIGLADALCRLGRSEEAAAHLEEVAQHRKTGSAFMSAEWRATQARVLARRGDVVEAEGLARDAVVLIAPTDLLDLHADVVLALAEVLLAGGQPEAAAAALEEALRLYQKKGNVAATARACMLMSEHPPQR
jgi:tetratricopeptide (TPR) repeat protein